MNKRILPITLLFFAGLVFNLYGQKDQLPENFSELPKLTIHDSLGLVNLPELKLPEWLQGSNAKLAPSVVDNSEQIYWRPVFAQEQYECGQASGVGLGFTYAINRLRDLPSDEEENQYPSHFTWNYGNGGNGWYGVSYFHSFEIIKREGCPNVIDFDGMTGTGAEMWMDGYDKYYNAMHNRVADVYKIDLTTEEGINTLRNWIHNHLDGSDVGGVANFYTNAPYGMSTLPSGTPEAGKYVVTSWSYANHGLTIAGYHDSICWDYNNDGEYTNDIDLNGDGEITPRDWEIGGLRFANTYSGGPSFGNSGFSYMTYKSCADPYGAGGIWDNAAHVVYAKAETEPLLTAKIKIKYNCRNRLRVRMGVSTDVNAESPDFILGFPIFNFQGGCQYMQGGTSVEDNKTIEFGLDITPFLNMIDSDTPARYFLLLDENDPEGWGWGDMINFSIVDYTDGMEEIICDESNVTINNDDLTSFFVDHTVVYESVEISTEELTSATVYEPYSGQLDASGGTEPYTWMYDMNFTETESIATFPMVNDEDVTPSNSGSGYTIKNLDFTFPFYSHEFNQVRVHADGYISFENMFEWPYMVYDFFNYSKNKLISPFQADLNLYSSSNDGIWYEGDDNSATFRWKASVDGNQGSSELNFAVELFSDGDIKFYYGETNDYPQLEWISGLSSGDNIFYQFTSVNNHTEIEPNTVLDLVATHYPEGFAVSRSGEMHGTPTQVFDDFGIKFMVIDENNLSNSKLVSFSTDGSNYLVVKNVIVQAGDDDVIEFGETVELTIEIESLGEETISGTDMLMLGPDMYVEMIDSTEMLGDFEPGEVKTFEGAFTFDVGIDVPDDHLMDFPTLITDGSGEEWTSHVYLTAHAPNLNVSGVYIDDGGSGGLDPGETANMIVVLHNSGGAKATGIEALLSSSDPYISINNNESGMDVLAAGASGELLFNITASDDTPAAYIIEFDVDITADNEYATFDQAFIACGLLMEGFESGNFESYPWSHEGNADWLIDDAVVYEGSYASRSGFINDDEYSGMEMEMYVLSDGEISFYRKVSSEANYDYLTFHIDGAVKDQWAGEENWEMFSYPVTAGLHTFSWRFTKDYSVSNGSDCGWIDNIILPPFGDQNPQLLYSPENILISINQNIEVMDSLNIYNAGTGPLIYTLIDADTLGNQVDWLSLDSQNGGLNPGDEDNVLLYFDGTELQTGVYEASIIITDHIDNEYIVPVWFHVDLETGVNEHAHITGIKTVPNPFSEQTSIQFSLESETSLTVEIYNARGERIKTLANNRMFSTGTHNLDWKAADNKGSKVNNGVYYYRITGMNAVYAGKIILIN